MGAKTTSEFMDSGRIPGEEGQYLLAISNHPSPMFVLGYVLAQIKVIPGIAASYPIWAVAAALYLPVLPISILARKCYHYKRILIPYRIIPNQLISPFPLMTI